MKKNNADIKNRNRSKRSRRLRIVIVVLASIILLASIALYITIIHIFPYSIIRPHRISRIEISALCPGAETPQDLKLNASPHKQWYPIAEGDHYNLGAIGGENYQKRIFEFFQYYLSQK